MMVGVTGYQCVW